MGCLKSKAMLTPTKASQRKTSVWSVPKNNDFSLTKEEWAEVDELYSILKTQGTDIDVVSLAFELFFYKEPKAKTLFVESGILSSETEDFKTQPRFRGHMREIGLSIRNFVELKNSEEEEAFELYIAEVRDIHYRLNSMKNSYFETIAYCLEDSLLHSLGAIVTEEQKQANRKFLIFLYNILSGVQLTMKDSGDDKKSSITSDQASSIVKKTVTPAQSKPTVPQETKKPPPKEVKAQPQPQTLPPPPENKKSITLQEIKRTRSAEKKAPPPPEKRSGSHQNKTPTEAHQEKKSGSSSKAKASLETLDGSIITKKRDGNTPI